jgi:hypothetical protein
MSGYAARKWAYDRDRADGGSAKVDTRVIGGTPIKSATSSISQVQSERSTIRLSMTYNSGPFSVLVNVFAGCGR